MRRGVDILMTLWCREAFKYSARSLQGSIQDLITVSKTEEGVKYDRKYKSLPDTNSVLVSR